MSGRNWAGNLPLGAIFKLVCVVALLIAANLLVNALTDALNIQIRPSNEDAVHRTIMVLAVLHTMLLAIPFVPGAEIGLAMIAMLGPPIAILVYVCTVLGLSLSFLVGRLIPLAGLIRLTREFRMQRVSDMLSELEPLDQRGRLDFLVARTSNRIVPTLLRHRYLTLAVALNIPANFLIGGGGGIAMFAGASRLYSTSGFLLTIALAVAPVPLAVLLLGAGFLGDW